MCSLRGSSRAEPRLCRETVSEVSFSKGRGGWLQPSSSCWRFGVREAVSAFLGFPGVWRCRLCFLLPSPCWQPIPAPATEPALAPTLSNLAATRLGLSAALLSMDQVCHHTLLLLRRQPTLPVSLQPFPFSLAGPFSSAQCPNVKGLPLVPWL